MSYETRMMADAVESLMAEVAQLHADLAATRERAERAERERDALAWAGVSPCRDASGKNAYEVCPCFVGDDVVIKAERGDAFALRLGMARAFAGHDPAADSAETPGMGGQVARLNEQLRDVIAERDIALGRVASLDGMWRLRPAAEWNEEIGPVLWWRLPIAEPPYCGDPRDVDWPLDCEPTHWTPIPIPYGDTPAAPPAGATLGQEMVAGLRGYVEHVERGGDPHEYPPAGATPGEGEGGPCWPAPSGAPPTARPCGGG